MPVQELFTRLATELRRAWRFRWFGVAVAWVFCLLGWGWVAIQPNIFEANARVYVDASSVLRPILDNRIVPPDVDTELAYVRQALLGRSHLERVVQDNDLDARVATDAGYERLLGELRRNIDISARGNTNAVYTITYRDTDRGQAVGVVRTLLNSLVESTLSANQTDTETAERFLDERIEEYEQRLAEAEKALAQFKKQHAERLPGAEGGYFERMRLQRETIDERERELRLAESRLAQLREQLNSEVPVMPGDVAGRYEPPPNSIEARIRDYRTRLDQLLLQYTDRHPDVQAIREALQRLEAQRARESGVAASGEGGGAGLNPVTEALRIAINNTQVEIASLEADLEERREDLAELQALIDDVPDVEAELARLNRDYDVIYEQYQSLVRSRETQQLSRKASDTDEVDFRVIDPPLADVEPVAPERLLLLVGVFVMALGAGGGICWLLAQLRPVFVDPGALRKACGLPVLGAVSPVYGRKRRLRVRMAVAGFACAIGALGALFGLAAAIELVGPGFHLSSGVI